MIKHIVIWPMKEGVTSEQKEEIKLRLMALNGKIPQLLNIDVGIDDEAGTMSLISEFTSTEDLRVYQSHPDHLRVGDFVKPLVDGRIVCDYDG